MDNLFNFIRRFPLSALCVALIWFLCFFTPPHTPLDGVPLMDKWTHFAMYGGTCSVMWVEVLRAKGAFPGMRRMLLFVWLCPVLMSGLIELLQAYCTGGRRSGEWLDFLANSIGVTAGFMLGYAAYRLKGRGR